MKTILNMAMVSMIASCLFFAACQDTDAVSPLTGEYKEPELLTLNEMTSLGKDVDATGLRHFTVELSGTSDNLIFEFIGNDYFLQSVTFTPAPAETAGNNTYVLEASNYNGSTLTRGNVTVSSIDNEHYVISGIVWAENGSIVKFEADGVLEYAPDVVVIDPIICRGSVNTTPLYGTDANGNWGPIEGHYENIISAVDNYGNLLAQFNAYTNTTETLSGNYIVTSNVYEAGIMNNGWTWDGNSGGTILFINETPYYITSGTVTIVETEDMIEISSTDAVSADADGNPGPMNFIYQIIK